MDWRSYVRVVEASTREKVLQGYIAHLHVCLKARCRGIDPREGTASRLNRHWQKEHMLGCRGIDPREGTASVLGASGMRWLSLVVEASTRERVLQAGSTYHIFINICLVVEASTRERVL